METVLTSAWRTLCMLAAWRVLCVLLLAGVVLVAMPDVDGKPGPAAAWADDDDDGDDDDDDADDDDDRGGRSFGGGGGSGGGGDSFRPSRIFPRLFGGRAPARPAAPVVRPASAPELIATGLSPEDLVQIQGEGFVLIESRVLPGLGAAVARLSPPQGQTLEAARDRLRALPSAPVADLNHFFRTGQAEQATQAAAVACTDANCPARDLVGWPAQACATPVRIGVVDTGVNAGHEFLAGADLEVVRLANAAEDPSRAIHGTAVVSLLVAPPGGRVRGLTPWAEVVAVDVFSRAGGDERASALALLQGLDLLASRDLRVVNLSLTGPENALLSDVLARLAAERGMVFVAAAGNGGPNAAPVFPAAHPDVLAVTAVDARGRIWSGAQRGDHVDLAAPGVRLLLATSVSGARPQTGTSYAVPFVTAAAALLAERPGFETADAVASGLRDRARDLGAPGRDPIFGAGLLDATGLCSG